MTILFLHGWQSTPGGVKPTYIKNHGHTVLNPLLPDDDFDEAVRIAQAEFDRGTSRDVVVGSSRGGAVAMNIARSDATLVLLCPAWKRWGTATTVKPGTIILHSALLMRRCRFPIRKNWSGNSGFVASDSLIEVGTEHRLADKKSLAADAEGVRRGGDGEPDTSWTGRVMGPTPPKHPWLGLLVFRDGLLRRSRYRRDGDRSQYPELVRRAGEAKLEPAELGLRPRVDGAVSEHGGGGLVGLAARGMGRCGTTADRLRGSTPPERPVVVPVLRAAPPRTRLRGGA